MPGFESRSHQWQSNGRLDISDGTADRLPLPDASCDTVVAVNNLVMWPDLGASLKEIKRVLRTRGHVVLSWHSATASSSTSRRLALSDDMTGRLTDALQATFGDFQRRDLTESVAWETTKE